MKQIIKIGIALLLLVLCYCLLLTACDQKDTEQKETPSYSQNSNASKSTEKSDKSNEETRSKEQETSSQDTQAPNNGTTHVHSYEEWETVKQATCTEDGTEQRYCKCGDMQSRNIPAGGHSSYKWVKISDPSCTEEGKKEQQCETCGYVKSTLTTPATGHSYPYYGEVIQPAGCTTEGRQIFRCTNKLCDHSYEDKIEPNGHSYSTTTVNASCETAGGIQYSCRNCSHSYFEETSNAIGSHNLEITGVCSRCKKDCSVDMRERISAPLTGTTYGFSYEYDNVYLYFNWQATNNSSNTIKYCTFQIRCYNGVGDVIATKTLTVTRPIASNGRINGGRTDLGDGFYYSNLDSMKKLEISYIKLEYSDGTVECGYYGYSTTQINNNLGEWNP